MAEEIEKKLSDMSKKIDIAVEKSNKSKDKVENMTEEIDKIGIVFERVMTVLLNVVKSMESFYSDTELQNQSINSLNINSKEIKQTFEDISVSIKEIDSAMTNTSESINQLVLVSDSLLETSSEVKESIDKFRF